jgi:ring-1,2-phenylacetyl-CoA epoxidase subunit PaaD
MVTPGVERQTQEGVWKSLAEIRDPEIPVLSLVDLGIVRGVEVAGGAVTVRLTPTFAGCPALHVMRQEVERRLWSLGFASVRVETVLDPPWTTDDLGPAAREKLRGFGLAPPPRPAAAAALRPDDPVACPRCGSLDTELRNAFGATACRTIRYCRACQEPFEGFKPV